jgi:hypothetical protein
MIRGVERRCQLTQFHESRSACQGRFSFRRFRLNAFRLSKTRPIRKATEQLIALIVLRLELQKGGDLPAENRVTPVGSPAFSGRNGRSRSCFERETIGSNNGYEK